MDAMANKENIANVVNGRFMMFLLKTRFYGDELMRIMVTNLHGKNRWARRRRAPFFVF